MTFDGADQKKILGMFKEISNSMTRAEAERDHIKTILNDMKDTYGIAPKIARKAAKIYHKQNRHEVQSENEDVDSLCDIIVPQPE